MRAGGDSFRFPLEAFAKLRDSGEALGVLPGSTVSLNHAELPDGASASLRHQNLTATSPISLRGLEAVRLIDDSPAHDGLQHLDGGDLLRWDLEEIPVEHNEVGQLADLE